MIKLVDLRDEVERDVEFGTCELCSHTGDLFVQYYVFQDDTGETREIEVGLWDWGDYDGDYYGVDNVFRFADFIREEGKELNFTDFDEETCPCGCEGYVLNFEKWFEETYRKYIDSVEGDDYDL